MEYFIKSFQTAKALAEGYRESTNAQRSNLAFGAAGNLSKAAAKRLVTIRNVGHNKYEKQCIRQIMLLIYETELFKVSGTFPNGQPFIKDVRWDSLNSILDKCESAKYIADSFEYGRVSFFSNNFQEKVIALRHFVTKYGSKTDIKILIPKLTPTANPQLELL